jgi:hypothetical protein
MAISINPFAMAFRINGEIITIETVTDVIDDFEITKKREEKEIKAIVELGNNKRSYEKTPGVNFDITITSDECLFYGDIIIYKDEKFKIINIEDNVKKGKFYVYLGEKNVR